MSVAATVKQFLDAHHARYEVVPHEERYTSSEIAEALHVPGRRLAKVVMLLADNRLVMAVLPSDRHVDLARFAEVLGAGMVALATEKEFRDCFPDCEVGAMPPFGSLYGIEVLVDSSLTERREIVFEGGNHHEAIRMHWPDFAELAEPRVARFAQP